MEQEFDISKIKFCIGMPIMGSVPAYTAISLIETATRFTEQGISLAFTYELNNSIVQHARNRVAQNFLEKSGADKLICIDSDITWNVDDLFRLCCWSSIYPFVGAMYPTKNEAMKFIGRYGKTEAGNTITSNEHGLVSMSGFGLGFVIIDRSVFEELKPHTEKYDHNHEKGIYNFFDVVKKDGHILGEDIYFMQRYIEVTGKDIWVDPSIELGHIGSKVYRGALKDALLKTNEEGYDKEI